MEKQEPRIEWKFGQSTGEIITYFGEYIGQTVMRSHLGAATVWERQHRNGKNSRYNSEESLLDSFPKISGATP